MKSSPLLSTEQLLRLEAAIAPLPWEERTAYALRWVDYLSLEEIGLVMDTSTSVIRRRLRKAEIAVRKALERAGQSDLRPIEVTEVLEEIRALSPELISYLRTSTDKVSLLRPDVFEELIAEFFASWGFDGVAVVGKDKWTGADVIAIQRAKGGAADVRYFIEVKRSMRPVGIEVIEKVYGAMAAEKEKLGWHIGMIVTASRFSGFVRHTPERLSHIGIELRDGADIKEWIGEYRPSPTGLWLPRAQLKREDIDRQT